jgi:hydroxyethylthiazole kinase-like uncharacterized protein yjeF
MSFEWVIDAEGPRNGFRYPLLSARECHAMAQEMVGNQPSEQLTQRAGLALAQLSLAVAPHAQRFWVACGEGNNGGYGLEAARHLHRWGKAVHVSMSEIREGSAGDYHRDSAKVHSIGLGIHSEPPEHWDICIDALIGTDLDGTVGGRMANWIARINSAGKPVLSADIPSGLIADTGAVEGPCVKASHTLCYLCLKPGMFTMEGRDMCGDIWLHDLDFPQPPRPTAWLNPMPVERQRAHASHKGNFGMVCAVGGAEGLEGAAILAARAASQSGVGRTYIALLATTGLPSSLAIPPDLMRRSVDELSPSEFTVVMGCGGGQKIVKHLPRWIAEARGLVLDADALNAVATDANLQALMRNRNADSTLITPHPLEAARLLGMSVQKVQADRIGTAHTLAHQFNCTVVLKGSGSIIAAAGRAPHINPTGNALLAIAGTGDVLAGMAGAELALTGSAWEAGCHASYVHGAIADRWQSSTRLTASGMLNQM